MTWVQDKALDPVRALSTPTTFNTAICNIDGTQLNNDTSLGTCLMIQPLTPIPQLDGSFGWNVNVPTYARIDSIKILNLGGLAIPAGVDLKFGPASGTDSILNETGFTLAGYTEYTFQPSDFVTGYLQYFDVLPNQNIYEANFSSQLTAAVAANIRVIVSYYCDPTRNY